jgi:HlyD family type I secretion membrane fusion protein
MTLTSTPERERPAMLGPNGITLTSRRERDWKRPAMLGYAIIILTFGVLGGWSAFARLDSAVVASGVVTLESSRKTLQHFEGGMVAQIPVNEGQHVAQGQLLIKLADTQPLANADVAHNQFFSLLAQEARLVAERDRADDINFPPELLNKIDLPVVKHAIDDQRKQFVERRASIVGQVDILQARIKQFETEIEGLAVEKAATERQLNYINSELDDLRSLLDKNLVQKSRVFAMDREKARLEGIVGRSVADSAKAQNGIGEAKLQIEQIYKKFSEEVSGQILEARQKIADQREKVTVSQDVLRRTEIRAPRNGTIQNLRVTTVGGVIRAGEPLMDLIPDEDDTVINAQVSPTDIDVIQSGMKAEIRFNSFHGTILPIIMGRVASVSRDRLVDEQSKQPYFLARIVVDKEDLPTLIKDRVTAGMSSEVIVPTGERTAIDYLTRPLRNRLNTTFRER